MLQNDDFFVFVVFARNVTRGGFFTSSFCNGLFLRELRSFGFVTFSRKAFVECFGGCHIFNFEGMKR